MARVGRVELDLLAQPPDVNSDRPRVEGRLVAPDAAHQLVTRKDPAGVPGEKPEQVELLRRQPESTPGLADVAGARVELDVAEAEALARGVAGASPAQHRPHAHRELPGRERLRDVVVGTELETDDAVRFLAAGGQQDDREVGAAADPPAQLEAVGPGKHHIEDDEVGALTRDQLARTSAVRGLQRRVTVTLEIADDDLAHD